MIMIYEYGYESLYAHLSCCIMIAIACVLHALRVCMCVLCLYEELNWSASAYSPERFKAREAGPAFPRLRSRKLTAIS